ncbi:MAG TPA: hypothetical protein VMT29_13870 [Steroidobacteraceae bacterium]|nr:hypothetical protein [Steroidobacteraceae bacterium]
MNRLIALAVAVVAMTALTACHPLRTLRNVGGTCHDPKPYMKANSVAPLKIPAGLDTPDNAAALHIPALNSPEPPPRKRTDPCLEEPPPFQVPKQALPQA